MNIFLDTNVLLSAFYAHGACGDLYDHCLAYHTIFTSEFVLEEFLDKAENKLKFAIERTAHAIKHIRTHAVIVPEAQISKPICKDKDDDHIIAAAVTAKAACIVTGDKGFLAIKKTFGISIVSPAEFWKFTGTQTKD